MATTIASTDVGGTGLSTVGTNGQVLTSNGTVLSWQTPSAGTSFSAGTTGFTPNTATTGTVTLAGTLVVGNGGTGLTSLTSGRIPYGAGTSAFGNSANLIFDGANLGVGLSPSSWGLSGGSAIQTTGGALSSFSNTNLTVAQNTYFNCSDWKYVNTAGATIYQQVGSVHAWSVAPSGTAGNTTTLTEAMRITSAGALAFNGASNYGSSGQYLQSNGNASPTWVTSPIYSAEILIVAGGGGAGGRVGGGGGAGGLLYYGAETPKTPNGAAQPVISGTAYTVTIGAGGTGGAGGLDGPEANGIQGSNSSFSASTAIGGGYGYNGNNGPGGSGGSGGGPGYDTSSAAGTGTSGQGNNSGLSSSTSSSYPYLKGGGGGAGAVGGSASSVTGLAGNGGVGLQYSISGTATYYAGGGGGGTHNPANGSGSGGLGGGGAAGASGGKNAGANATANTGGGGGGASTDSANSYKGGNGGSGIVIIRYLSATQKGSGGTVTTSGGYYIHTFTSSGTYVA